MSEESYELRSNRTRYARIDAPEPDTPLRASLEDAYRSSSDAEYIDELDPLTYDESTIQQKRHQRKTLKEEFGKEFKPVVAQTRSLWRRCAGWCCWLSLGFVVILILLLSVGGVWVWRLSPSDGQSPPWYPSPKGGTDRDWQVSYKKAADLVEQMTLVEMVNITTGVGWGMGLCVGNTGPVYRLGFPSLCLQDGPLGLRFADNITAWPAGITTAATWNKELIYQRGKAQGVEARLKGVNTILGPSMGSLGRIPAGGRNWEGFGPDPVLAGIAAAQTIKGIQEEGVMATAKHFVGNEQEHFRQALEWGTPNAISSNIDDRTLHEVYGWPFAESIKAGVASVMCSYNQVNNSYACGNSKLMNGVLKDELGFQGFIQSDWLAQRSGVASALSGLDMSMPGDGLMWANGDSLWGHKLTEAVLNTSLPIDRLHDMTTRIVAAWYQLGQDDEDIWGDGPNFSSWTNERTGKLHDGASNDDSEAVVNKFINAQGEGKDFHGHLARKIAAEGIVLLKNQDDILPLSRDGPSKQNRADKLKHRIGIYGEDARGNEEGPNACKDRACNEGTLAMGWGSGAVEFPYLISPLDALEEAFNNKTVEVNAYPHQHLPNTETDRPENQDLCIVFANADAGEGFAESLGVKGDRNDLLLQKGGNALIEDVAKRCGDGHGDVLVVIHSVGPVLMEHWIDLPNIKAVLLANLPGEESGNALVDVLLGDVNPSGHLPYTIAKTEEDYGPGSKILYYPNGAIPQQNFTEGLYIDYRHLDKQGIEPRFEFGYGLSYTQFHLSSLLVNPQTLKKTPYPAIAPQGIDPPTYDTSIPNPNTAIYPQFFRKLNKYVYPYIESPSSIKKGKYPYPEGYAGPLPDNPAHSPTQGGNPDLYTTLAQIRLQVTNQGSRTGSAVVQLYVSFPEGYKDEETGEPIDFPVRVLRNFEKVEVPESSKRRNVQFDVTRKDLSYWCSRRQNWVLPTTGEFKFHVGFSSRDLPLEGSW